MSNNNIKIFLILETLTSSYRVVFSTSLHSLLSSCIKIDFLLLLTTWLDIICVFARFYCSLLYNESSIVVQSLSRVQLFVTPWTAAHQASLSFTVSQSLLKLMCIASLCHPTISSSVVPFSYLYSFLASGWRSLVGCSPWGRKESDTTEWLHFHFSLSCIGEGNGNPLQCSCLENPRDRGA